MTSPAIIATSESIGDRPAVTYRQAGDRGVLVEYGGHDLDLRLNFVVIAVFGALLERPPQGFREAAPGFRSILVHFDPAAVDRTTFIDLLMRLHERQPDISSLTIPGRIITLPIAFDDSACREAVQRYVATIDHDAPNAHGGGNIDFLLSANGLPDREALFSRIIGTSWWGAFTGFVPGLPFLFPLGTERPLFAPKYNPPRAWTAEGSVALGGSCVAIHPVPSPGSYQLVGRTLPIYDIHGRHARFADDPFLIRAGDRVRFEPVCEAELLDTRRRVFDDRYDYRVEDAPFVVAEHLDEFRLPTAHTGHRATGSGAGDE